jgi:haloalkane dehalogenase
VNVSFEPAPPLPRFLAKDMPFTRRMAVIDGTRIHFVDEGASFPETLVLLVHGNPTWSYLWRKVIPLLAPLGVRVVAPDLLGLGLSDKPRSPSAHSVDRHVSLIEALVRELDPERLVLVGQDWGGPIAMGVGRALDALVNGIVLANTSVVTPARPFRPKAFHRFSQRAVISDIAFRGLMFPVPFLDRAQGDRASIGWHEKAAYAWPLRRPWERAAPLGLARMVPTSEHHPSTRSLDAIGAWVEGFDRNAALVWGVRDPILGRALGRHQRALPHASGRECSAGHFLQEEVPELLANAIGEVL